MRTILALALLAVAAPAAGETLIRTYHVDAVWWGGYYTDESWWNDCCIPPGTISIKALGDNPTGGYVGWGHVPFPAVGGTTRVDGADFQWADKTDSLQFDLLGIGYGDFGYHTANEFWPPTPIEDFRRITAGELGVTSLTLTPTEFHTIVEVSFYFHAFAAVPEPASFALGLFGLALLGSQRQRR